jgi:CMP-N,N'-diacetyllegionaminic acid synthase
MSGVLCTICARGGSKGVKNKNIKELNGKPLIAHTIEQAAKGALFEHIVVSTDSDDIATVSKTYGADVFFKRSAELSGDTAGKLAVIKDAFVRSEEHYGKEFDYLVDLDATSPLRDVADITNSYEQFLREGNDNLITACPSRKSPYFNMVELYEGGKVYLSKKPQNGVLRRQDAPKTYDMNASIYIWKRDVILGCESIFLEKTGLFVMDEDRSIDIDSELDFEFVEFLMRRKDAKR